MTLIRARFQKEWPGFSLRTELELPARGVTALFGPLGQVKPRCCVVWLDWK